jgi:hypothetical protein
MKHPSEDLDINAFEAFINAAGEYESAQGLEERLLGKRPVGEDAVNINREILAVAFLAINNPDQACYSDALKRAISFVRLRID